MCPCETNPQTTVHLLRECNLLSKQRQKSQKQYYKGGRELANTKHRTGKHVHEYIPKVCELYQYRNITKVNAHPY